MVITINVSKEQIKLAEALARRRMMLTGETASRSSEFGRAIEQLAEAELPHADRVAAVEQVAA